MLRLTNSQTRKKEEFKPLDPNGRRVTMYTCGPTVYDSLHLGHARFAIVSDLVRRYLEHKGYDVRYVMNITDVDDKIIKRALKEDRPWREVTAEHIDEFHRIMMSLNFKPADMYPRATDHIAEMLDIVQKLIQKKNAYVAADGDIYFDTSSYARYGNLANRKLDEEEAGRSGRISEERLALKKNQGDFLVWKLNKNDGPELAAGGDAVPGWDSPWGKGRPGWHLECSAMSAKYLDVPFDIHAGGQDLLFPHHEDEKAQTECAFCEQLGEAESVRYWIHNAFVTVKKRPEDEHLSEEVIDEDTGSIKMSKSLGNVSWLREMIWPEGPFDPMAIRMMLLSSHYRSPIVFEPEMLDEAKARLDRIYNALESAVGIQEEAGLEDAQVSEEIIKDIQDAMKSFEAAMDDDFNSAGALAVIFELIGTLYQKLAKDPASEPGNIQALHATISRLLEILGIRAHREQAAGASGASGASGGSDAEGLVNLLLETRKGARTAKQYALSDQVRDGLAALGYEIKDLPDGNSEAKKV